LWIEPPTRRRRSDGGPTAQQSTGVITTLTLFGSRTRSTLSFGGIMGDTTAEVESVQPDLPDVPVVEVVEPFGQDQLPCTD
jgi:hypothetical protein